MNTYLSQHDWQKLVAWCDGELPENQRAEVSRHVAEDQAWADALESLRLLDSAMDAWDVSNETAEAQLVQRTVQAARAQRAAKRRFRWTAGLAAAAAVLIFAGVAMHILTRTETPPVSTGGNVGAPAPRIYGYIELDDVTRQELLAQLAAENQPDWVATAIDSFTEEEQTELLMMSPSDRLNAVVQRHNDLVKQKLVSDDMP